MSVQNENLPAIHRFLAHEHVLSLCASSSDDIWCANCFYVFDPVRMALYLMSDPQTRHGRLMANNPRVVGTIAHQTRTVARIKGVQFSGHIALLDASADQPARARYCHQFPLARAVSAPIWELCLDEVKMTDNALGFGKKVYWTREPDPR